MLSHNPSSGASNKGTSQSRETNNSTPQHNYSSTSNNRPNKHPPKHNHNHNNNNKNKNNNNNKTNNNTTMLIQFTQPYRDKLVAITNILKVRTATTKRKKEQTIIFSLGRTNWIFGRALCCCCWRIRQNRGCQTFRLYIGSLEHILFASL